MMVSRFLKINDIIICTFAAASYFASVFCYIYGKSVFYIYVGAMIASTSSLHYAYARSIVSKCMRSPNEVSDALSLILIVDTFIAVVSVIVFPILYSSIVSQGIDVLFFFSNAFVGLAVVLNM